MHDSVLGDIGTFKVGDLGMVAQDDEALAVTGEFGGVVE